MEIDISNTQCVDSDCMHAINMTFDIQDLHSRLRCHDRLKNIGIRHDGPIDTGSGVSVGEV